MANQTRQLVELLRRESAVVELVPTNAPYRLPFVGRVRMLRAPFRLLPYVLSLWKVTAASDVVHLMANSGWSWHLVAVPAIWVAHLRGVPVIVNYRGGEAAEFLDRSGALVRWSMRRASRLAVPSGFLEQVFTRHGMQCGVLPNVVDLSRFRPRPPRVPGSCRALVARNLEPLYDNATALRAFVQVLARYPGGTLTLAGIGPEETRLKALAAELGIAHRVEFTGRLESEAMAALYRQSDLLLNPSRADNLPNSLLEAWASGVPVVSTDVGGIPFMAQDGRTALLVPPGRPDAMAGAALRVLDDAALWHSLAQAGLEEAQRYTWARVAPRLAALYREALASAQRGP